MIVVSASARGTWRGAVLPAAAGVVFIAVRIAVGSVGVVVAAIAFPLAGFLRAVWWAKVCATSQLVSTRTGLAVTA
jgi:hypothetical protein